MKEIEIPKGVEVKIDGEKISIKGGKGSTIKSFNSKYNSVKVEGNKILIASTSEKKLAKKGQLIEKALYKELSMAIEGVEKGFEKKMKLIFAHFPVSIESKDGYVLIKNLFGEKIPRKAKIIGDTKVEFKGQEVYVRGADIYDVEQTTANIRNACAMHDYDDRVFQDGLYISKEE